MPYEVHTPVYEGPFDLLLHLITQEQVDLYEISIRTIVDAYLAELDRILKERAEGTNAIDLETATQFLLIAATLVELKSRRLLPNTDDGDLDEELALWEERDLLLSRLLECKTFKDASAALQALMVRASESLPRRSGVEERFVSLTPDPLAGITAQKLHRAMTKLITPKPQPHVDLAHVAQPVRMTVGEAVEELVDELPRLGRVTFRRLTAQLVDKVDVIVRFLAVLELFKQGAIDLDQAENFGDLHVVWLGSQEVDLRNVSVEVYEG